MNSRSSRLYIWRQDFFWHTSIHTYIRFGEIIFVKIPSEYCVSEPQSFDTDFFALFWKFHSPCFSSNRALNFLSDTCKLLSNRKYQKISQKRKFPKNKKMARGKIEIGAHMRLWSELHVIACVVLWLNPFVDFHTCSPHCFCHQFMFEHI